MDKSNFASTTRRSFMGIAALSAAAVAASGFSLGALADSVAPIGEKEFLLLSQTLTGRKSLDAGISARALKALIAVEPTFGVQAAALSQAIAKENFSDMSKFDAFADKYPKLKPAAIAIISAWYLGYTGTPEGERNSDNAQFVCYETALMYESTLDATIVPTFSRGHTNYWADPPAV